MPKRNLVLLLALGHGLNDCIAGFFLGRLVQLESSLVQAGMGLFIYNLLAFGGQYPVAIWLEKLRSPGRSLLLAFGLNLLALGSFSFIPQLSIILAGIASAIYHVAGGSVCAKNNRSTSIGFFAAPGVIGLIFGGYAAYAGLQLNWWLMALSLLMFFFLLRIKIPGQKPLERNTEKFSLDRHDLVMILLLTVISLRSLVWNIFQLINENNYEWLFAIAIAAALGKIIGGWLADRIGWRFYIYISLAAATPLLTLFRKDLFLFCLGVGLLQSGIPATTSLLIQNLGGKTERAIGLSFGTAIILGAIIFYTPYRDFLFSNATIITAAGLMAFLILYSSKMKRKENVA